MSLRVDAKMRNKKPKTKSRASTKPKKKRKAQHPQPILYENCTFEAPHPSQIVIDLNAGVISASAPNIRQAVLVVERMLDKLKLKKHNIGYDYR